MVGSTAVGSTAGAAALGTMATMGTTGAVGSTVNNSFGLGSAAQLGKGCHLALVVRRS